MDVEMRMPDLATTGSPIKVLRWLVDVGQSVRRGEPLLEVETDKAVMQVESVISGRLSSVSASGGDEVEAGKTIAIFETDRAGVAVRVEETSPATSETAPDPPAARDRDPADAGRRESFFARNREARARRGRGPAIPGPNDRPRTIALSVPQRVVARRMEQSKQDLPHFSVQMMTTVEQLLARLGSGIESTPGVCGGDPRIAGTRIPVWTLEHYRRLGLTEAQILGAFPALRATDLVNAWSYVAGHRDEIECQIRENEEAQPLARLYADENFPYATVEALRRLGPKLWQGLLTLPLRPPKVSNPDPGGRPTVNRTAGSGDPRRTKVRGVFAGVVDSLATRHS